MKNKFLILLLSLSCNLSFAYTTSWTHLETNWFTMEIPEENCYNSNIHFKLYSSGKYHIRQCSRKKSGSLSVEKMKQLQVVLDKILPQMNTNLVCDGMVVQDYEWNYRLKMKNLRKPKRLFYSSSRGSCGRRFGSEEERNQIFEEFESVMWEIAPSLYN